MQSRVVAYARIMRCRADEWELLIKNNRSDVLVRLAHSLPFEVADRAKNAINDILHPLEGQYHDSPPRQAVSTTPNPDPDHT